MKGNFVGFGFGAIQGGLFLPEVQKSGSFVNTIVAEIDPTLVGAIRSSGGTYSLNVAGADQIYTQEVRGLQILNPLEPEDRKSLVQAISEATELCTALPSFKLYDQGEDSVAKIIAEGLELKLTSSEYPPAVIYAAENDSRAAKRLKNACLKEMHAGFGNKVWFSETVIGKMCSVVTDSNKITNDGLVPIVDSFPKAFLVEQFDKIYIDEAKPAGFTRGLSQFIEKRDLDPFAIAKFLGQNATHATLGYLAEEAGLVNMNELEDYPEIVERGLIAYIEEAGEGLRQAFGYLDDELFTKSGFAEHANSAVERMLNPFLSDPVQRVTRDPIRKLGWDDRLIGAMRLAYKANKIPQQLSIASGLAFQKACAHNHWPIQRASLDKIWSNVPDDLGDCMADLILNKL